MDFVPATFIVCRGLCVPARDIESSLLKSGVVWASLSGLWGHA